MTPPLPIPFLDLTAQYASIRAEVDAAVRRVVEAQRFVLGREVEALEAEIAGYVGAAHAVGVASGTDALVLTLRALGAEAGAEVVVPAFTFFATAGAVVNAGLRPVFCDVDPATCNVSAETLEAAWTARTVAAVPVHLFGRMAPMDEVRALARRRGAFVLEDAAQAIGARQRVAAADVEAGGPHGARPVAAAGAGRARERELRAGSAGDAAALSFYPTKNLGGFGDGGMVTTGDPELARRVAALRVHGGGADGRHDVVGTNARLDALQAAVLRAKLPHLDAWTAARRAHARRYDDLLRDVAATGAIRLPGAGAGRAHVYHQYVLRAERRDALRAHLEARGVGTAVHYPVALHLQPCFAALGYAPGDLPVAERLCGEVLSLPIFPELGAERQERVAEAVRGFYG